MVKKRTGLFFELWDVYPAYDVGIRKTQNSFEFVTYSYVTAANLEVCTYAGTI